MDWECAFLCSLCVGGPWKVLKNGCNFLYKPLCYQWPVSILCFPMFLSLGVLQKHKWEDAMTVDKKSWGYRRNTVLSDFLTMDDLTSILASAVRWDKIPCLPAFPFLPLWFDRICCHTSVKMRRRYACCAVVKRKPEKFEANVTVVPPLHYQISVPSVL